MPPVLVHDLETLRDLLEALRSVYRDVLLAQRGDFELAAHEIGHQKAADAVESFYEGWNDGRVKVLEGLDSMIQSLKAVISKYEGNETDLSRAYLEAADFGGSSHS